MGAGFPDGPVVKNPNTYTAVGAIQAKILPANNNNDDKKDDEWSKWDKWSHITQYCFFETRVLSHK